MMLHATCTTPWRCPPDNANRQLMSSVSANVQGYFLPLPKAFTDGRVTADDVRSLVRWHF